MIALPKKNLEKNKKNNSPTDVICMLNHKVQAIEMITANYCNKYGCLVIINLSNLQLIFQIRDMPTPMVQFPFEKPSLHSLQQLELPWSTKGSSVNF